LLCRDLKTDEIFEKMSKYNTIIVSVFALIIFMTSCYPDDEIYPEETDTVYTTYLPGTNFNDMKYYLIVDSVFRMDSAGLFGNNQYDELIINRLEQNLQARGYENASGQDSSEVDFMVVVTDISRLDITYYWSWLPYGYLYPDYSDETMNAYYPLPPPTNVLVGAKTGMLIDILEYNYENPSDTTHVYWRGVSNGVQTQSMEWRITSNIDRMFFQSPNLKSLK